MQTDARVPEAKRKVGCMAPLLLALGLGIGGLSGLVKIIGVVRWQTAPHVTATVVDTAVESFGNASQGNQGTVCTRWYRVPGYPEAKSADVSCYQLLPPAPDPGEEVEVAYGGTGSPVTMGDIVGVGLQEIGALLLVVIGVIWIVRARR